jgi:uncharacterized protein (DUF58 family)
MSAVAILPAKRMLWALVGVLVISVAGAILAPAGDDGNALAWPWWLGALGLLIAASVADALAAWRDARGDAGLAVERRVAHTVPVGVATDVAVKVTNLRPRVCRLELHDHHPVAGDAVGLPHATAIPPGRFAQLRYQFTPTARGDLQFGPVAARLLSPLGLWHIGVQLGSRQTIRSFPNYAAVTRYALLAVDHRLSQMGVLKRRRRGEGMDFHQLRDYREGDSQRTVDWKATARRVKLISREYQDERDQQVMFLIDCSRRMNARDDALSHFDHTLNAVLLMTYVAIRQGDSVGLMTFGLGEGVEERFLAPKKSPETVTRFLNALYSLQPSLRTPDYYQAALALGKRLTRRALVVVVSNVRDEEEEGLSAALALLKRTHLVLFANLKESAVEAALLAADAVDLAGATGVADEDALLTQAAASRYALEREAVLARMRARGVQLVDSEPAALPIQIVNQYLDLKQRGVV